MIRASRTLCAVAKKALGRSNRSGENKGVNSAWYLILEAIDEASGAKAVAAVGDSVQKQKPIIFPVVYDRF